MISRSSGGHSGSFIAPFKSGAIMGYSEDNQSLTEMPRPRAGRFVFRRLIVSTGKVNCCWGFSREAVVETAERSIMTDWNDPELNPLGLMHVDRQSQRVNVTLTAKVLAYFTSADENTYICAFVDEVRNREVFTATENGYIEVTDPDIKFIVAKWTNEIIDAQERF
jgi:hypothetical protein